MIRPPASAPANHQNSFQLVRFILASAVVYSHSYTVLGTGDCLAPWVRGGINVGRLAVDGFFLLSGFLIAGSYLRSGNAWDYLNKRTRRIYPGFAVAWLISMLVVGPLGAASVRQYFAAQDWPALALWGLTLGPPEGTVPVFAGLPFPVINVSLWSIRYEFFCYLLLLGLGMTGLLARPRAVIALTMAVMVAYLIQIRTCSITVGPGWLILAPLTRLITFFLVGVVFRLYRGALAQPAWLLVLAGLVGLVSCRVFVVSQVVAPWLGGAALLGLGSRRSRFGEWFDRLPDISYGIYLYGWTFQILLANKGFTSPWSIFAISLPLSCVAGYLSWTLVEGPAQAWRTFRPMLAPGDVVVTPSRGEAIAAAD